MESEVIHRFNASVEGISRPERLNSPFKYTPHPLAVKAAGQVRDYIAQVPQLRQELQQGKMLGVLVVEDGEGRCAFLAACSGSLKQPCHYFVPPVFDLLAPDGYFKREEAEISQINRRIEEIENGSGLAEARRRLAEARQAAQAEIDSYKQLMERSKAQRDQARQAGCDRAEDLVRESQHQKAQLRRLRLKWQESIAAIEQPVVQQETLLQALRKQRKERSEELQRWIFGQFVMLNSRGERHDLLQIFAPTPQRIPPAGAGECAAPRLLQYAFAHGLKPLAIAEFWYGGSPRGLVRHDGNYYPACRSKCLPILTFMLDGLIEGEIDPPYYSTQPYQPRIIYRDQWLLAIDKPSGIAVTPGPRCGVSLLERLRQQFGEVYDVHRIDMDTSGVVLFALDKATQRLMHALFAARCIDKRYIAVLDGLVPGPDHGTITLPLRPDYEHRPMQVVDHDGGHDAATIYTVTRRDTSARRTTVELQPLTGRTHQLRIHAAHHLGLGCPIVGDRLYGRPAATPLMLHASCITFTHPQTHQQTKITAPLPNWD